MGSISNFAVKNSQMSVFHPSRGSRKGNSYPIGPHPVVQCAEGHALLTRQLKLELELLPFALVIAAGPKGYCTAVFALHSWMSTELIS